MIENSVKFGGENSAKCKKSVYLGYIGLLLLSIIVGLCFIVYLAYYVIESNVLYDVFIDGKFYGLKIITIDDVSKDLGVYKMMGAFQSSQAMNFLDLLYYPTFLSFLAYYILNKFDFNRYTCLGAIIIVMSLSLFSCLTIYIYNEGFALKQIENTLAKRDYNHQLLKAKERYLDSSVSEEGYVTRSYKVHKDRFINYLTNEGRFEDGETNLIEEFNTIYFDKEVMTFSHLSGDYLVYEISK